GRRSVFFWSGHPDAHGRLMPGMATRTRSPRGGNWPSSSRWLPTAVLVWAVGESPDHHNVSRETLGGALEWLLLVAGDPQAGRQARHRGSCAEVYQVEHRHGWLSGRVVGPSVTTGRSSRP